MNNAEALKERIRQLPELPGIYKYFDQENTLIYVGKAKSLRKRVSSYFTKTQTDRKTMRLVSQIRQIEYIVVDTEYDALLLENSLIKEHQPKYNIMLRDDKSYPYICITTNERFPRVFPTRRVVRNAGLYFGPYPSGRTMNALLELIKKLYTFRTCNYALTHTAVNAHKFKVCLEYHIGNCKGPCEAKQTEADYNAEITQATHIIRGHLSIAKQYFKEQMLLAAENYAFEEAQRYKEKLALLDNYQSKSVIVNPNLSDIDVFSILSDENSAYINYLRIVDGSINLTHNVEIKKKLNESPEDILAIALLQLREQFGSQSEEVLVNIPLSLGIPRLTIHVPQIGDKRKLLDLSIKNTLFFKRDLMNKATETPKPDRYERVLKKLQADLRLTDLPDHVECFDNSNIQGSSPVAAMVCFKNGKASPKDYRHFNIKTVVGPDDFASMHEIVTRRYSRLIAEKQPLPKLIIIDGGKGQLGAACEALKALNIYGQIPIIGIAKRLEEIYYPEDPLPLMLPKKSESLIFIQRIRDETHRFAITFHRSQRSKKNLKLEVEKVKGLGAKTIAVVYREYKSLNLIREEDRPDIEALIGAKRTELLFDYLKERGGQTDAE